MGIQKPTITQCIDAKEHAWLIVAQENYQGKPWEHRWCQKCGVLTQVTFNDQNEPIAVLDETGTPYLMTPNVLRMMLK
jgi:hypothetical protein